MSVQALSSPISYTRTAKLLHWFTALFILINFALGLCMEYLPGFDHASVEWNSIFFWHGSIGALVLWLAVARLVWRAGHPAPPLPRSVPVWQVWAAHLVHAMLYLLMFALPLSGYAHRVAGNHPVSFFKLWNWPSVFSPSEPLRVEFGTIHLYLVVGLACLLFLHLGAVFKHLLLNRDGVAQRMWISKKI